MAIDLERFNAPIEGDDPAGPDLTYDPDRFRIEQAFEVAVGPDGAPDPNAPTPDWREIVSLIVAQADRTQDLWLAVYLARAGAQWGRFDIVLDGLHALAGLVEQHWDHVHPSLDEYGFQARRGACDTLASFREFVGPLQRLPLFEHPRFGSFTAEDLVRFARGGGNEDGYAAFQAILDDAGDETLTLLLGRLDEMLGSLRTIDAVLDEKAGDDTGTNFAPIYESVGMIRAAANAFLPPELQAEDANDTQMFAGSTLPQALTGREDVIRALDLVIDFYRRYEPSSPIPLILERAKTWVSLEFMDILQDIIPRSVEDATSILMPRTRR